MTKNSVVIKGNKYGIVIMLNNETSFEEIKENLILKFKEATKFFGSGSMALTIEGKKLSEEEEKEVLDIISEHSELNIICIMDNENEDKYRLAVENIKKSTKDNIITETKAPEFDPSGCQFYKGTLRSGQEVLSNDSVIILGDVNPGSKVESGGNVIILGSLKGSVYAGMNGDNSSFVVALEMNPVQIRIGDFIARSDDKQKKLSKPETKIAYVDGGNIYIDPLNKEVLNELNFRIM